MSKKLDITEHHLMVLSLFTRGYDNEYYIREVCRHLPMSHGTAQSVLHSLEKKNILESNTKGKIRLFRLTNSTEAAQYCKFCELYKRLIFISEQTYAVRSLNVCTSILMGCMSCSEVMQKGVHTSNQILIFSSLDHTIVKKLKKLRHCLVCKSFHDFASKPV